VKGNSLGVRALISLGPQYLCFLRYLLSSAEFRFMGATSGKQGGAMVVFFLPPEGPRRFAEQV